MRPLLRSILRATQLTNDGHLAEATATLQRALSSNGEAGAHVPRSGSSDADVGVVRDAIVEPTSELAGMPLLESRGSASETGSNRSVHSPMTERPRAADVPPSSRGRFLESSYSGPGGTRAFKVFVPSGFEGEALPLVVMLHGCTQDPDDFAAGTRMNALAQERGFIVLYPAQAPRSNSHKCWNWFSPRHQRRGSGEPALLAGMTRHVLQTHSVDRARVYVAGLSAGGAMAAILAREYPDLFAAAGIHSGVAAGGAHDVASAFAVMHSGPGAATATASSPRRGKTSTPPRSVGGSVPVIVFHGDADHTVVAANGDAVVAAALQGSDAVPTTTESSGAFGARAFRRTVWQPGAADDRAPSIAEQWVVHRAPHAWSGGDSDGSFTDPSGPDASREMLRFFLEHPRRS